MENITFEDILVEEITFPTEKYLNIQNGKILSVDWGIEPLGHHVLIEDISDELISLINDYSINGVSKEFAYEKGEIITKVIKIYNAPDNDTRLNIIEDILMTYDEKLFALEDIVLQQDEELWLMKGGE
jgi:hypothetical protein